jgi:hypothetical protein
MNATRLVDLACLTSASCALSFKRPRQGAQRLLTFPSPPLKFRTVSFPQYGFKQEITQKGPSGYHRLTSPTPLKEYPRLFALSPAFQQSEHLLPFDHGHPLPTGPSHRKGITPPSSATTTRSASLEDLHRLPASNGYTMKPHALKTFPSLTAHLSSVDAILTPEGDPSALVCFFPGPTNHRASLPPWQSAFCGGSDDAAMFALCCIPRDCSAPVPTGTPRKRRMSPTSLLHLGFLEIRHLLPSQTSLPGRTDNLPGQDFHPLDTQR